jgi:hypothetical protein
MRSPTHSASPLLKCMAPVSPYPSHSSSKFLGGLTPQRSPPMRLICVYLRSSVDKHCISNAPCRMRSPTYSTSPLLKCMATVSESFFEEVPWWTNATTLAAYATNLRLSAFICGQTLHIECSHSGCDRQLIQHRLFSSAWQPYQDSLSDEPSPLHPVPPNHALTPSVAKSKPHWFCAFRMMQLIAPFFDCRIPSRCLRYPQVPESHRSIFECRPYGKRSMSFPG